jgi:class 3 adenylate cyclase/tetratricopeptide (TPR) repeat protein
MRETSDGNALGDAPRRSFLTLLYTDLSASTALAGQLQFEEFAAILDRLRAAVVAAVARHGGLVVRTQGDGSLAIFGQPTPGEHDARHACHAALEVHAEVAAWPALPLPGGPQKLALHSGVHSGLVYVSKGDMARGHIDVVGDAVHTAARLAAHAGRHGLLADAESLGPEISFFETEGEQELTLPGRAVSVRAVRITGVSALQRRIDAGRALSLSPLLGRSDLLEGLLSACRPESSLAAQVLEVRGPAGIGKTRLLDALAERLIERGLGCWRGGCESYGITPVLQPFRQILAQRSDAGAASPGPGEGASSDAVQAQMLAALRDRHGAPLVLLLDDWQWADDASRKLLEEVIASTPRLRVVIATRPQDEGPEDVQRSLFTLQPLSLHQTRAIVEAWMPGTNPFLVDALHDYAGGVPLLVEEMCHTLRRRGEEGWRKLHQDGPRTGSGSWMKSLMAARLASLPEPVRTVARAASVVGIRAQRALLNQMLDGGLDEAVQRRLADADLLYADGPQAVRFSHGLTRDAVYEMIPLGQRVALHRKMAALLAAGVAAAAPAERLQALAHHTAAAGDWAQATLHCEAAADEASRLGAFDNARRHYVSAIDAAEFNGIESPQAQLRWCSLIHRLGMTCMFDPLALPDVMPLIARCVDQARALAEPENLARSLYWQAYLSYVFGQPRRAVQFAREALVQANSLANLRLAAQIEATLSQALAGAARYAEALTWMDRAVQAKQAQAQRSGSLAIGSAFTLATQASILADQGDFPGANAAFSQAHALIAGHPTHPVANSVRNWEMVAFAWQGRWDDALHVVRETTTLAERTRALLPLAIARAAGGYARWRLNRDPTAAVELAQAVRWMEARRVLFFTTIYYGWLVEICVAQGEAEEARRWMGRLLQRSRAGERLGEAVAWRAMAAAALAQGDIARALLRLRHAEAAARRRGSAREQALNALLRADVLAAQSRADEAQAERAQAEERLRLMHPRLVEAPWRARG